MLLALGVIVALLGQSLGYWHLLSTSSASSDVTVPRVYGQSTSSAEARLRAAGLQIGKISSTPDSQTSSGTVIRSIPAEGQQVSKGTTVELIVSSGKQPSTTTSAIVPGVTGDSLSTAESIIQSVGLHYSVNFIDSTSTANTVLRQTPAKGAKEPKGSTIQLYVSNGTSPPPVGVTIPSVTSDDTTTAANALGKKGFNVSSTYSYNYSSAIANGYVIGTQPPAGSTQPYGSTVTLIVSQGPAPATVPDVVGDTLSQAESTLTNDGFTPTEVCQSVNTGHQSESGYVMSQSPAAYSQSTAGANVQITYGAYPSCSTSSSSTSSTTTTTTTTTPTTTTTSSPGTGLPGSFG